MKDAKSVDVARLTFERVKNRNLDIGALESGLRYQPCEPFTSIMPVAFTAGSSCRLARTDGKPVGAAMMRARIPELFRVYAASAYRGRGLGTALVAQAVVTAAVEGSDCIVVVTDPGGHGFVDRNGRIPVR